MSQMIEICRLTKDYGSGRGVFDLDLQIAPGEVFGFLGPNGAGKSTTIRQLLGFVRPDKGSCVIDGKDCFQKAAEIQKDLGYLPGELSLFSDMTGQQMLDFMCSLKGIRDMRRRDQLMERFELNPKGKIRKMSKGMKQKIGLICAFMGDPKVLILDEPTSGLDPLMQNRFVELIQEEKNRGKTIFMSSHDFEEVERTCERVGMIRAGRLADTQKIETLSQKKTRMYTITLKTPKQAQSLLKRMEGKAALSANNTLTVAVSGELAPLLRIWSEYDVVGLDVHAQSLEELFLGFYGEK